MGTWLELQEERGDGFERVADVRDRRGASYTPLTVVFASVSVAGDLVCSTTSRRSREHRFVRRQSFEERQPLLDDDLERRADVHRPQHHAFALCRFGDVDAGCLSAANFIASAAGAESARSSHDDRDTDRHH